MRFCCAEWEPSCSPYSELQVTADKVAIEATTGQQRFMCPFFSNDPVMQDEDAVGQTHCGQVM